MTLVTTSGSDTGRALVEQIVDDGVQRYFNDRRKRI